LYRRGFTEGRRTADHIFIVKMSVDKYLRAERGILHWWSVDFDKYFYFINTETLWFKMSKI
jgi:hypothetical protein